MEVAVIGLGNAGRPVARRLLDRGHSVGVYDSAETVMGPLVASGARAASSAADACRNSDVVFTVLPGPAEVDVAVNGSEGVLQVVSPGQVLADLSGIDPGCAARVQQAVQAQGGRFVGCTLHAAGAPARTIPMGAFSIAAGGDRADLERVLPLLQDLAMTVVCLPSALLPKAMKIAMIMLAVTNHIAATEVAVWLSRQGLDPALLSQVMKATSSSTPTVYLDRILAGGLHGGGNIRNTHKDVALALGVAAEHGLPLPLTASAEQLMQIGLAQGLEDKDLSAAMRELYATLVGERLAVHDGHSPNEIPDVRPQTVIWAGWSETA